MVNLSRWHDTVSFWGVLVSGFWVGAIFWVEELLVLCSTFSAGARNRRSRMRDKQCGWSWLHMEVHVSLYEIFFSLILCLRRVLYACLLEHRCCCCCCKVVGWHVWWMKSSLVVCCGGFIICARYHTGSCFLCSCGHMHVTSIVRKVNSGLVISWLVGCVRCPEWLRKVVICIITCLPACIPGSTTESFWFSIANKSITMHRFHQVQVP